MNPDICKKCNILFIPKIENPSLYCIKCQPQLIFSQAIQITSQNEIDKNILEDMENSERFLRDQNNEKVEIFCEDEQSPKNNANPEFCENIPSSLLEKRKRDDDLDNLMCKEFEINQSFIKKIKKNTIETNEPDKNQDSGIFIESAPVFQMNQEENIGYLKDISINDDESEKIVESPSVKPIIPQQFHNSESKAIKPVLFTQNRLIASSTQKFNKIPKPFTYSSEDEEQSIRSIFYCSEHIFHPVKYFCLKEKLFFCENCSKDHKDHDLKEYSERNMKEDVQRLNDRILLIKQILTDCMSKIEKIENNKINDSETVSLTFKKIFKFLSTPGIKKTEHHNKTLPTSKAREVFLHSKFITTKDDEQFILSLFQKKISRSDVKLLFRASKDGFTSEDFHLKCDKKGPTFIIIKSKIGNIFGGFASEDWRSKDIPKFQIDENSFLFSLTHKTKHELFQFKEKSLYFSKNHGPVFGAGYDLCINENCNENFANLGISYEGPNDMESDCIRKYLGGEIFFNVEDYEVFGININFEK